jgi:hypothetical protein
MKSGSPSRSRLGELGPPTLRALATDENQPSISSSKPPLLLVRSSERVDADAAIAGCSFRDRGSHDDSAGSGARADTKAGLGTVDGCVSHLARSRSGPDAWSWARLSALARCPVGLIVLC